MEKDKSKKSGILPKNVMVKYMTHIQVKNLNGIRMRLEHGIWDINSVRNIRNYIKTI